MRYNLLSETLLILFPSRYIESPETQDFFAGTLFKLREATGGKTPDIHNPSNFVFPKKG